MRLTVLCIPAFNTDAESKAAAATLQHEKKQTNKKTREFHRLQLTS